MSLYKQKNSEFWWANISVPGHPRLRRTTGETDRVAAQRVHDELKAALWKVDPLLKGKTWGGAVLKWARVAERSDAELASIMYFGKHFPDCLLGNITPEMIDVALSQFCKTPETYTRHRARISAILRISDIHIKLEERAARKKEPRTWLTHEQWVVLRAELPPHMRTMADFAIATGLRQANVLTLRWAKVDIARKLVWIDAVDAKGGRAIAVPLSVGALDALTTAAGAHPEFVFTYRGHPVSEIKTAWISANLRAGTGVMVGGKYQGFTWHGMRHTWATWHVQSGTPLDVLQKLGGWSDHRMVLKYAHHSPGYLAQFADNASIQ